MFLVRFWPHFWPLETRQWNTHKRNDRDWCLVNFKIVFRIEKIFFLDNFSLFSGNTRKNPWHNPLNSFYNEKAFYQTLFFQLKPKSSTISFNQSHYDQKYDQKCCHSYVTATFFIGFTMLTLFTTRFQRFLIPKMFLWRQCKTYWLYFGRHVTSLPRKISTKKNR